MYPEFFQYSQLCFFGFKNLHVHGVAVSIEFACPHASDRSGFTLPKLGLDVFPPYRFIIWRGSVHDFRTSSDSKVTVHTLSDSLQIYFVSLWRTNSKISVFAADFAGCVWTKPYPERNSCGFKNIRIRMDGSSLRRYWWILWWMWCYSDFFFLTKFHVHSSIHFGYSNQTWLETRASFWEM